MIWNDDTEATTGISREEKYGRSKITYVEIVRCKECRHCAFSDGEQLADCMIKQGWFPVKPEWFCADGERKE